jgi:hypothetical protein
MTAPTDDLVAHEPGAACACGPVAIPIVPGDGSPRFHLVGHRRLDGLPTLPHREDAPVVRLAPRLVSYRDSQRWVVVAIFAVAGILGLAFM